MRAVAFGRTATFVGASLLANEHTSLTNLNPVYIKKPLPKPQGFAYPFAVYKYSSRIDN